MWLIVEYHPAALFSLKIGVATSTGAKTLFLPTPFAVRMAFLDAAIRTRGLGEGEFVFERLKSLRLAALPPERVVVTNLFAKVQKPRRSDKAKNEPDDEEAESVGAMQKSIAFREYAHLDGALAMAFEGERDTLFLVESLALQVNYFGKRGSFFQWTTTKSKQTLPSGFTRLDEGLAFANGKLSGEALAAFPLGVIQLMDDWDEGLTFEKANVYSGFDIRIPKDRVRRSVVFPYRLTRSSRGFSYYEWDR